MISKSKFAVTPNLFNEEIKLGTLPWARSGENVSYAICEQQRSDKPVHPRSLISTFVVHCLDSMICILAVPKFQDSS